VAFQEQEDVRKIQFSGKSSYMLSLPKKWVEEMKLGPGDQVTVTRLTNASLMITPRSAAIAFAGKGEATIELSCEEDATSVERKLIALYLVGYSLIHARAKEGTLTSVQRDAVKEAARRHLIGTEVVSDSAEGTTIQILLSYPELSVENALRRMFLIAASMHKDAMLSLKKSDQDSAKAVIKADDEVDRFGLYVVRQLKMAVQSDRMLKQAGLATATECLGYRLVVKSIERVADHASRIAEGVLIARRRLGESDLNKLEDLSNSAVKVFEESGLALFKRSYDSADRIVEKTKRITDLEKAFLSELDRRKPAESSQIIRVVVEDVSRTAEYSSDIAEIVLNMTAEQIIATAVQMK
jgi:phosphate uptake regulator